MSYEGTFDVVIEGLGSERGARVLAAQEGLYVNKQQIPYTTLLGVALRGSILLVMGTQVALALRGKHEDLASLAAELRGRADLEHLALSDREALEGERVVFATPVAMSGLVEMERFKGMALAVVTDSALHVFERGGRHFRISWDRINKVDMTQGKFGRLLRIGSGATQLEFLYLTDAQIQTIRGLATRHSSALLGVTSGAEEAPAPAGGGAGGGEGGGAAAAPQVATAPDLTRRFNIPEFEASLGAVGSGSDRPLGAAIDRLQMSSLLPVGFLEEHLRELRNIYDGVLLKAKRDAASATDVFTAAAALDGRRIWDGVLDSIATVTDATVRAFERQARRVAANRRIPWRKARKKFMPSQREISGLKQRLTRGVSGMEKRLTQLSKAAAALKPASEKGQAELKEAYATWQQGLAELDQAYATGWAGLSREVVGVWQDAFLPKLTRLGGERRRLLPRSIKVAFYFVLIVIAAGLAYLYFTGQLGQVIQFE
ncbi:MAG: hypothetical protein GWN99_19945 [Gemmatimonadetes bacterium]|uniref:Uncharacterized protein n=1 Tax=Candidatus Kutchimonas denitrificans TaxID=3056748 RepID=A0AAE4ZA95_9BACT|nr:hypothetical protein [Gemmatimonadota bacterium]NIR76478.1 hypothetical protein [Candidatus Kutchimonas denitrificans]NIS03296.1 hypothetical protein [Gemmatimonadota bacterium]NIT69157.1 hypothetical protein [Gemmatimonadota bacterium]NIU54549.1 hypothetical protein [Gemmatimonadota bacterium]